MVSICWACIGGQGSKVFSVRMPPGSSCPRRLVSALICSSWVGRCIKPLRAMMAREYFRPEEKTVISAGMMLSRSPIASAFFAATRHISSERSVPSTSIPRSARYSSTAPVPQATSTTPPAPYLWASWR